MGKTSLYIQLIFRYQINLWLMLYFFIDLGDCAGGGGWGWHNLCLPVRISPQPPAHHNTSSCRDSSGSRNTAPDISSGPTITACPHNFIWNLLFPKGLYSPNLSASLKFFSTLDNLKNKRIKIKINYELFWNMSIWVSYSEIGMKRNV